jgi:small subunit ribosomal protein S3
MGQKVRPTGFRIGVMETWRSRWYASKKEFGDLLLEDYKIRHFVATKYASAEIARVEIERTRDLTGRRMDVKIVEITNPNRNAALVALKISQQLEKRGSFRRAIKKTLDEVMSSGVEGVKIQMSGRLGGAEMSRCEKASRGSIPLSTLRRHIDYGFAQSKTTMGVIGVKVWIDLGDYSNEETADGANAKAGQAQKKPKRTYKR